MRRLAVLIVPLLTLILAACAQAQGWQVEKITQPVEYTLDAKTWNLLQAGMEVPNKSWIKTGARGRLILRRQAEMIQFKPNTVASITTEVEAGVRKTRIKQKAGSILLDVETRSTKHTSVETPFLAAVVKGTRFSVEVGRTKATLRVERGVVETTDFSRGERVSVQAGQNVTVDVAAREPLKVTGRGPKAPVARVAPRAPSVKPALSSREARAAGLDVGAPVVANQKNATVVESQKTHQGSSNHPDEVGQSAVVDLKETHESNDLVQSIADLMTTVATIGRPDGPTDGVRDSENAVVESQIAVVDLKDTHESNDRLVQSIADFMTTVATIGRPDGPTDGVRDSDNAVVESRPAAVDESAEPGRGTHEERLAAREARIGERVDTRVEQRMAASGHPWAEARVSRVETRIQARIENRIAARQSQHAERRNARREERKAERVSTNPSQESAASGTLGTGNKPAEGNEASQPAEIEDPASEGAPEAVEPGSGTSSDVQGEPGSQQQEPNTQYSERDVQQEARRQAEREERREERKEERQKEREERKEQRQEQRQERKERRQEEHKDQQQVDQAAEGQAEDLVGEDASGAETGAPDEGAGSGDNGEAGGTGSDGEARLPEDGAGANGKPSGTGGG